jgi:two-component system sensor histidine kinase BaeS
MRRSVGALSQLIDDLFELAQLDAGAIERETGRARLDDVVMAAMEASRAGAGHRPEVHRVMDGAGDAICSPRMVRVLQNLLTNAIRHTPPDGTITIEAESGPGSLTVAVVDTGDGIPEAALGRVFEPFWRGDPARSQSGAGLGLALSKRIVEALGGTITATSRLGEGSRFAVTIPQASSA